MLTAELYEHSSMTVNYFWLQFKWYDANVYDPADWKGFYR